MGANEWRKTFRLLTDQGWTIEIRRSGHVRAHRPDGRGWVDLPNSPRMEPRNLKNLRAKLRRAGADL